MMKHNEGRQQGVTNRSLDEELRQQEKLPARADSPEREEFAPADAGRSDSKLQGSASKTGMRSGARKSASANRDGIAPGKARRKAGAEGLANRVPANTVRTKHGTTQA